MLRLSKSAPKPRFFSNIEQNRKHGFRLSNNGFSFSISKRSSSSAMAAPWTLLVRKRPTRRAKQRCDSSRPFLSLGCHHSGSKLRSPVALHPMCEERGDRRQSRWVVNQCRTVKRYLTALAALVMRHARLKVWRLLHTLWQMHQLLLHRFIVCDRQTPKGLPYDWTSPCHRCCSLFWKRETGWFWDTVSSSETELLQVSFLISQISLTDWRLTALYSAFASGLCFASVLNCFRVLCIIWSPSLSSSLSLSV